MKHHLQTETTLKQLKIAVLKRYGQNFLVDSEVIASIMNEANIKPTESVIEIGPGLGALTEPLLRKSKQLTTFEIDQSFHKYLQSNFPEGRHFRLNFLKAEPQQVDWIIGNLPYYVTTEIIEKIYKDFAMVKQLLLMVQAEVWPRIVAQPGDASYGPLAIFIATLGTPTQLFKVFPEAFYPEPHVQSIVFSLRTHSNGPRVVTTPFFYFIKKLFLHRRKTILNNLTPLVGKKEIAQELLDKSNIALQLRPEMITVNQFLLLFQHYQSKKSL